MTLAPPAIQLVPKRFGPVSLLAAPLDATENLAILWMLEGHVNAPWPQLSTSCAAGKFALLFGAAAYLVVGLFVWGVGCALHC